MPRKITPADVAEGWPPGVDPYMNDATTNDTLTAAWDRDVAARRATQTEDAFASPNPAQQQYFHAFNNAQEDAATGPAGYNRQWVPFLQSLKGKRIDFSGAGLPTETYADLTGSGRLTRLNDADVAALRSRALPESHEAFLQRLYGSNPPDHVTRGVLPQPQPPAPTAAPPTTTVLPQQPPLGSVAALLRRTTGT
jgi:hypothetical protein